MGRCVPTEAGWVRSQARSGQAWATSPPSVRISPIHICPTNCSHTSSSPHRRHVVCKQTASLSNSPGASGSGMDSTGFRKCLGSGMLRALQSGSGSSTIQRLQRAGMLLLAAQDAVSHGESRVSAKTREVVTVRWLFNGAVRMCVRGRGPCKLLQGDGLLMGSVQRVGTRRWADRSSFVGFGLAVALTTPS
jgi:hypothetical protein